MQQGPHRKLNTTHTKLHRYEITSVSQQITHNIKALHYTLHKSATK